MKNPRILFVLGRPGSGKGTQAGYLRKDLGLVGLSTGALLRKRASKQDYTGKKLRKVMKNGDLVPTTLAFFEWMGELNRLQKKQAPGIIIDGSPRKILEAWMLDDVVDWYEWKNVKVLNIAISEKEAIKRLVKRGRFDDEISDIKNRLKWYKKEVEPVIKYYKKKGMVVDINGEQSRPDVYKELRTKLKV